MKVFDGMYVQGYTQALLDTQRLIDNLCNVTPKKINGARKVARIMGAIVEGRALLRDGVPAVWQLDEKGDIVSMIADEREGWR